MALLAAPAQSQTASPATVPAPVALAPLASPTWTTLSKAQQTALQPLAVHWDKLSDIQRRKWLAIAKTYPELAPAEQEKMHSRMVDWAALSPKDRELARLNFAQTKSVNKTDRAADWEAYQALSPEERQKLAEAAKPKPVGAAVAVKPVASDKLANIPITRHSPEAERASLASRHPLNRSTLLPQPPAPAPVEPGAGATATAKP